MNSTSSPGRNPKRSRSALGMVTCPFVFTRLTAMVCSPLFVSPRLRQRRFSLGQPEGHVHVTIEGNGSEECRAGLLALAGRGIQRAEAAVAVGLEWAHTEFLGQGQGLLVVGCGLFVLRRFAPCRNLAEEVQSIRLVATFLVYTGKFQRSLSEGVRLLHAASQQICLPQGETTERLKTSHV